MIRAATVALLGVTASASVEGQVGGGVGAACATNDDCKRGLFCDGEVCADVKDFSGGGKGDAVGSACEWDGDCADELRCIDLICTYVGDDLEKGLDRKLTELLLPEEGEEVIRKEDLREEIESMEEGDEAIGKEELHREVIELREEGNRTREPMLSGEVKALHSENHGSGGEKSCTDSSDCGGFECVNAYTKEPVHECGEEDHCYCKFEHPCDDFKNIWYDSGCGSFELITTTCGNALLPGAIDYCDECAPILPSHTIDDFGGSCSSYCEAQGLRCEAAMSIDEDDDDCNTDHLTNATCGMDPSVEGAHALCVCADYGDAPRRSALPPGRLGPVARMCRETFEAWEGCMHELGDNHGLPDEEWKRHVYGLMEEAEDHFSRMPDGCASVGKELAEELKLVTCAR